MENIIPLPQRFEEILLEIKRNSGMPVKLLRGIFSTCKRNKSLIVSDQTIQAERLGEFFKHIGNAVKNVEKKILDNPGRALELEAITGTAATSKNRRMIVATAPDVLKFVHQGNGLYLGKIH